MLLQENTAPPEEFDSNTEPDREAEISTTFHRHHPSSPHPHPQPGPGLRRVPQW